MNQTHDDHQRESEGPGRPHSGVHADTPLSEQAKRVLAIQELLVEKGVLETGDVERVASEMEARSPADGARVVARAWVDPEFKERLLQDSTAAVKEFGYELPHDPVLAVVENTEQVHHLVVCTLCSCYPTSLLGRPPDWYKSFAYRSRAVVEPRAVMREFGLELDEDVVVSVVDSTADLRYLVLPRRPAGTEDMTEKELARLVTRDSMIGVSNPSSPERIGVETDR